MRIGVVSDTHNNLKNVRKIVDIFNESEVERVIHTGDISQKKTLDLLSNLNANLFGVYGNNDQGELHHLEAAADGHGFYFTQPPLKLIWYNQKIVVVHDPLELELVDVTEFDVVLHGHTHRETINFEDDLLTFNPGECAGMMSGQNAVGILDLATRKTEIIKF